ncbi:MAG: AraC family transcriptional regulator [Defluviitaleaceae bacterium]|nr:AraC family transcriptional regulator [Defluviitaleaceae bacterium]
MNSIGSEFSPVASDNIMATHPPYFLELELTRFVANGEMEHALAAMKRINTFTRSTLADNPVRSLKNSLICNCTFLARAAIAGGVPPEIAFTKSDELILIIEESDEELNLENLENLEHEQLAEFVAVVKNHNTARFSKPVRDVITYINGNLNDELNLAVLASISGHNPNYLSSIFRKETGVCISDYIMSKRIEDAKFLLCHTNNPISEIANYYQFSSQSHFTQRFAKITGMTPLVYRKSLGGIQPVQ